MERSANPVLNDRIFEGVGTSYGTEVMTINGTVNKTLISLAILAAVAWWTASDPTMGLFAMPALIVGVILAVIISLKPSWAPALTPVYAAVEGCFLGAISLFFEEMYPGLVVQALALTFATLFALLAAYKSGYIKASPGLKRGLVSATLAILIFYLVAWISGLFGFYGLTSFFASNSMFSIGVSLVIVAIAALNLVLDFDFIESAALAGRTPKYMEWYGAFGLLVTLIWLYIEILRLLAKFQSKR